ncbi:MAG: hypothetical protein EBE86_023235 [Hormoscilla sp. GUM202]|nr:hypothetical protein [Hormoscilla sp. GUM202]
MYNSSSSVSSETGKGSHLPGHYDVSCPETPTHVAARQASDKVGALGHDREVRDIYGVGSPLLHNNTMAVNSLAVSPG